MRETDSSLGNYFRTGAAVSRRRTVCGVARRTGAWAALALVLGCSSFVRQAGAQYPGRVSKPEKAPQTLRSVAVLEWVGEPAKPSASRLVPVTVYDGEQLNDGTIYLNRPEPLALAGDTEYELQSGGKATRLFDVFGSGEVRGAWQGFGAVKPLPSAEAEKAASAFNTSSLLHGGEDADDDKPVLKRKHPQGSDTDDSASAAAKDSAGSASGGASAPDRPTLKRKGAEEAGQQTGSGSSGQGTGSGQGSGSGSVDPDRPTLRRARKSSDAGMLETSNQAPDPDRPRLKRGKPAELENTETPRLDGMPPGLQQAVAVSDATNRAEHPWKYTWANPDDELKMKRDLEAIARTALGMDAPQASAKPAAKTPAKSAVSKKRSMLHAETAAEPPALVDEQFRVFELTYGATATLVLTAASPKPVVEEDITAPSVDETPVIKRGKPTQSSKTEASKPAAKTAVKPAPQKFVTLIAQPDLYGGLLVLFKSVTDAAHLDETPRMRLIDAVDAMGDNRGEILFELRGAGQRQFALYRVLRGSAEKLFATVALP